jgi:hypothetical protein
MAKYGHIFDVHNFWYLVNKIALFWVNLELWPVLYKFYDRNLQS